MKIDYFQQKFKPFNIKNINRKCYDIITNKNTINNNIQ